MGTVGGVGVVDGAQRRTTHAALCALPDHPCQPPRQAINARARTSRRTNPAAPIAPPRMFALPAPHPPPALATPPVPPALRAPANPLTPSFRPVGGRGG